MLYISRGNEEGVMIDLEDFEEIETENMKKYVKSNERLQYGICRGSKRNLEGGKTKEEVLR